jgi:hypothetical protein
MAIHARDTDVHPFSDQFLHCESTTIQQHHDNYSISKWWITGNADKYRNNFQNFAHNWTVKDFRREDLFSALECVKN